MHKSQHVHSCLYDRFRQVQMPDDLTYVQSSLMKLVRVLSCELDAQFQSRVALVEPSDEGILLGPSAGDYGRLLKDLRLGKGAGARWKSYASSS